MSDRRQQIRDFLWDNDDLRYDQFCQEWCHPLAGHCYVASEALFHVSGGYTTWYVERREATLRTPEGYPMPVTHWYLRDRETGEVVDLTAEQFPENIDYDYHTRTGFLTEQPSERAQVVIDAVSG